MRNPIRIVEGSFRREEKNRFEKHHQLQRVEEREKACEVLMETMRGQPAEEPRHAAGSVEGAWKAVMAW